MMTRACIMSESTEQLASAHAYERIASTKPARISEMNSLRERIASTRDLTCAHDVMSLTHVSERIAKARHHGMNHKQNLRMCVCVRRG